MACRRRAEEIFKGKWRAGGAPRQKMEGEREKPAPKARAEKNKAKKVPKRENKK